MTDPVEQTLSLHTALRDGNLTFVQTSLNELSEVTDTYKGNAVLSVALANSNFLEATVHVIQGLEGYEEKVYFDTVGKATIGYGFWMDQWGKGVSISGVVNTTLAQVFSSIGITSTQAQKDLYSGQLALTKVQAANLLKVQLTGDDANHNHVIVDNYGSRLETKLSAGDNNLSNHDFTANQLAVLLSFSYNNLGLVGDDLKSAIKLGNSGGALTEILDHSNLMYTSANDPTSAKSGINGIENRRLDEGAIFANDTGTSLSDAQFWKIVNWAQDRVYAGKDTDSNDVVDTKSPITVNVDGHLPAWENISANAALVEVLTKIVQVSTKDAIQLGTKGDDKFTSEKGNDTIIGGGGHDTLYLNGKFGNDKITEIKDIQVDGKPLLGDAFKDASGHYKLSDGTILDPTANGLKATMVNGSTVLISDWNATTNPLGIHLVDNATAVPVADAWIKHTIQFSDISISGSFAAGFADYAAAYDGMSHTSLASASLGDAIHWGTHYNNGGSFTSNVFQEYPGHTEHLWDMAVVTDVVTTAGFIPPSAGGDTVIEIPVHDGGFAMKLSYEAYFWTRGAAYIHDANGDGYDDYGDSAKGRVDFVSTAANDTYISTSLFNNFVFNQNYGFDTITLSAGKSSGQITIDGVTLGGGAASPHVATWLADNLWGMDGHHFSLDAANATTLHIASEGGITVTDFHSGDLGIVLAPHNLTLTGTTGNDTLSGATGNDTIHGNAGNDTLYGYAGDDFLYGDAGKDSMAGGIGNDSYFVDSASDKAIENENEGTDKVYSTIAYTLGANLENLTLIGTTGIAGYGNNLDNIITGTSAANQIYGADGNDTLFGGAGNDGLHGDAGSDSMVGGIGNDTYYVDNVGDAVVENASEGTDKVVSSISYSLGANVENLTLSGTDAIDGTGNQLANTVTGNSTDNHVYGLAGNDILYGSTGNDTLIGGEGNDGLHGDAGSDSMVGGIGNDSYYVDNAGDVVTENASEGTDKVVSSILYSLGANVENLTLSGTADINGMGNELVNSILGNSGNNSLNGNGGKDALNGGAGNDTLIGGAGADALTGGVGNDTFVFNNLTISADKDTIKDFVSGQDRIAIDHLAFGTFASHALGMLTTDDFTIGTAATTASQHIVYNSTTGALFYDADGMGGAAQIQIALVTGHPALSVADFMLI
ncbi:MAG: hypothetical protein V4461_13120 [Pseudomonadota bacterium]